MVNNNGFHIADQFKRVFSETHKDQIQKLIHESRQEAFAQAKEILKGQTLNSVMRAILGDENPQNPIRKDQDSPSINQNNVSKDLSDKPQNQAIQNKPALSDRILEEIEAIREQILRNEELLSQIKPLIGHQKATEDKR